MGQRLVFVFTQKEIDPKDSTKEIERIATTYEHWSGYTASAIESANKIQNAINEFIDTPEYKKLTPHQRFDTFIRQLGTGKILEGAQFTEKSRILFDNQFPKNSIMRVVNEIDPKNLNRNNGLIDIETETESSIDWGEMIDYIDLTEVFQEDKPMDEINELNYFDSYNTKEYFKSPIFKTDTIKSLKSKETYENSTEDFFENVLYCELDDYKKTDTLAYIFNEENIEDVSNEEEIFEQKNYETSSFYIQDEQIIYRSIS